MTAYGRASMSHTQLEALGIENVFDDIAERNTEVSSETLVERDPDVLVLLGFNQTDEEVEQALLDLAGVSEMKAVREGRFLVLDFFYSSGSTLAVDGLDDLAEQLAQ